MTRRMLLAAALGIIGYLVGDRQVITVSGRVAHACTYNVQGTQQTVIVSGYCPYSMEFE